MSNDKTFIKGEFIFREGETAQFAYVVKSGAVEVLKIASDDQKVLAELGPNAIFGEMALIDASPRSASVRSKGDSVITEITADEFKDYIRNYPETALRIMRTISEHLRSANIRLAAAAQEKNVDGEVNISAWSDLALSDESIADTDAIYQRSPSKPLMIVTVVVLLFFTFGAVFASINEIETTISSRGKFTTQTPNVIIESNASSTVKRITVERGDMVRKGDVIVELDDTIVLTNLQQNEKLINNLSRKITRIELERLLISGAVEVVNGDDLDPLNLDTLQKRVSEYRQMVKSFESKLSRLESEKMSTKESVDISREQTAIKEQLRDVQKDLYDAKIGTLLQFLAAEDSLLVAKRAEFNALNSARMVVSDISTLQADKSAFQAQWASKVSGELTVSAEEFTQLKQERVKLQQSFDNILVRAPVSGIVLDLPAVSAGGVVSVGDMILTIVQIDQPLFLEVDIDPKNISDIRLGMPVSVKIDSMPFQEFGDIEGKLIFISQDTFTESLSGEAGLFYRARVETVPLSSTKMPSDFLLTQGMQANADLKVGTRRLITYFTYPILKAFEESFREPD
jgi:HlyD family secretion protein